MASSRAFSKIFNFLLPFEDFVWILQKEEYSLSRYVHWLGRFFFRRNFTVQEKLVRTKRALVTVALAAVLTVASFFLFRGVYTVGILLILLLAPLFVLLSAVLLAPLFALLHARVRRRAALLLARRTDLTVIVVAGSYGKTTTKNFIYQLLRFHHQVQLVSGNINTPSGLAAWLCTRLSAKAKILIVEADSYNVREMEAIARMLRPHVVLVTNVGDQHLERFKTKERLARALSQLSRYARGGSMTIADEATLSQVCPPDHDSTKVQTNILLYKGEQLVADQLSVSNKANLALALAVVERFDVPVFFVHDAVTRLELPDRRQKPGQIRGYEGIDDSYNISLNTAKEGLKAARVLADSRGRKLLVIAAGIPELGPDEKNGNILLGQEIARTADEVAILNTMFADDIAKGVGTSVPATRYATLEDFFTDAAKRLPTSEWALLQQPALPDLYY